MPIVTDDILIQEALAGDSDAFKQLVLRHEGKVAGVVCAMLGRTPEAEDVGQEVFIRLYERLGTFRGEAALSTFLVRIAINLSLNELRRRKIRNWVSTDHITEPAKSESSDLKDHLQLALLQLDADFRAVVTLRLVEGYSSEETASLLDIPLGTVLSRLARAQRKLRLILSIPKKNVA